MAGGHAFTWLVTVLCQWAVFSWRTQLLSYVPSVCRLAVPVVVRPQSVGPGGSWASCLSFALQLALVLRVPVGSLLPYGSHPSRWGHACGVEASLSSIGTKVSCVFSFPLGCFFVLSLPFGMKSPYGSGVLVLRDRRWSWVLLLMDGLRTSV